MTESADLSRLSDEELLRLRDRLASQRTRGAMPEVASESGVGFLDRAASSFGGSEQERENILRARGYEPTRTNGGELGVVKDGKVYPLDEPSIGIGDVADMAGATPSMILGTLGMFAGSGALSALGAAGGSAAGDVARQGIARQLGSGAQGTDVGSVAVEGALGLAGEGVGRLAGKALSGPFRRATRAPDFRRTMDQMSDFDTRYGTNLEGLAPADVQADSDFLSNITQRVRESQFGGQRLRESQDTPFRRELSEGFERIRGESGAAGPPGTEGPFAERVGESQAGRDLKGAASETLQQRRGKERELYDAFRAQVDPTATPELNNTMSAIEDIQKSNILRRGKVGTQGLESLRNALEEVDQIQTFDDLEILRQAVQDEIADFDPSRMSRGVEAQLKRLRSALRADEDAFLEAGGGAGSGTVREAGQQARSFSRGLYGIDESSAARRVFRDDLKLADIPDNLRRMNTDEVRSIRQAVGAEGAEGGIGATSEGMAAWDKIGAEVLEDLKLKARNPNLSTADEFVISGDRLSTELSKFKPGSLEEILGPETANALRNYADMVRNATVSERQFANTSRTAMAEQSILNDLADFFRRPGTAAGKVIGRLGAEKGAGALLGSQAGKRYLLGQAGFQQRPRLLEFLGRLGGQGTMQSIPEDAQRATKGVAGAAMR